MMNSRITISNKTNITISSLLITLLLVGGLAVNKVQAIPLPAVLIYWDDTKTFSDIDAGVNAQHKFTKRVKQAINIQFAKLAGRFPRSYRWQIHIHDINLAGKVTRIYRNDREPLRVYDSFFNPSMTFSYRLLDATGKVIANDKHFKLTDFYVTRYPAPRFMQRFLSYEKLMLKAWFNKVLLPFILACP